MLLWKVVRPVARAAFSTASRLYLIIGRPEYRYVFILGHMRSGSSLLAHILASHPDFAGAGESHISYRTAADLQRLVLQTSEFLRRPILRQTYIVDQINHLLVTNDVLLSAALYKCIILLRQPEATLKSMMKLLTCQEDEALDLYISRLKALTQYGLLLRERALLVEYDDLVDRPNQTLAALADFLGLDTPLLPTYATHRMTAREGYGDPSNNIRVGHILRTPTHEISISGDTLIAAVRAYHDCHEQLQIATVSTKMLGCRD